MNKKNKIIKKLKKIYSLKKKIYYLKESKIKKIIKKN